MLWVNEMKHNGMEWNKKIVVNYYYLLQFGFSYPFLPLCSFFLVPGGMNIHGAHVS